MSVDPPGNPEYAELLSLMWSALPDPDAFAGDLPARPPQEADAWVKSPWWAPLVHLSRFGLGLVNAGSALPARLGVAQDPVTLRARRLVELWWGDGVDEFAVWGHQGGDRWLRTGGAWPMAEEDLPDEAAVDLGDMPRRVTSTQAWQTTWVGGGDPLHLATHSCHPLSPQVRAHVTADADQVVLQAAGYGGWYRALMQLRELAGPGGMDVVVRIDGFGELGTYRVDGDRLPHLVALPGVPSTERRYPGYEFDEPPAAPPLELGPDASGKEPLMRVVLRRCLEELRASENDHFVLEVNSKHEGAYAQALSNGDGSVDTEISSSEFITPPLDDNQLTQLRRLGWNAPNGDRPNHWRDWPTTASTEEIAETIRVTLKTVFGADTDHFSLSPVELAAKVTPDHASFSVGDEDHLQRWLSTIERATGSPSAAALSVARCPEVDAARAQAGHPCRPIVTLQPTAPEKFQVPEAWAGNLQEGRIVFVSSNPSISEAGDHQSGDVAEMYPTADWADDDIVDFVKHRFDSDRGWATPDGRFLRQDGTLSPKPVAFWNNVRHRATELLNRPASPADDYAMTEVVHCKSKGEVGVASAAATCVDRHLGSVLALSPAELVVVLGQRSRSLLAGLWPLGERFGTQKGELWRELDNMAVVDIGGRRRLVVYLWNPTGSTAPKTFTRAYPGHLEALRALVRGELAPHEVMASDVMP